MEIINTTKWRTSDLRAIFSRCIVDIRRVERLLPGDARNEGLLVTVNNDYRSVRSLRGRASIGRFKMLIKIGIEVDFTATNTGKAYIVKLARTFIHEYYHNLGYRDQDRRNYANDYTADWDVGFLKGMSIRLEEEKVKPTRDIQMERYEKVLAKVKEYETKLKRTKTLLRKWKEKQKYYERVLTAAGKIGGKA